MSPYISQSGAAPAPAAATAIHRMVDQCRANAYPALVARLRSGWVVMGEKQILGGYCLLLPDPVVGHLNALAGADRMQFLADMALTGDAVRACTNAVRVNYAIFGNLEPALHAHIFPRLADEPAATRSAQPWALDWSAAPAFSEEAHGEMRQRVREYFLARGDCA